MVMTLEETRRLVRGMRTSYAPWMPRYVLVIELLALSDIC